MLSLEEHAIKYDTKLLVGSIIWEYLYPLMNTDSFLMEE